MMDRVFLGRRGRRGCLGFRVMGIGVAGAIVAGFCAAASAQVAASGAVAGKRPMTFADLQQMKRVSDPQVSPSGRWVMFSVTEVDLEKNSKVNHLWVVPLGDGVSAGPNAKERQVTFWKEGES